MGFVILLLLLLVLYLFAVKGRTGSKKFPLLCKYYYAHRGLHSVGVPENSMSAFLAAKEAGYGIELDVHLMMDGNLAVIHDSSLKRTTGEDVRIEELSANELDNYCLLGSNEKIPLLQQVLNVISGEIPLIVELKTCDNNIVQLCKAVSEMLDNYQGAYCIESFDPRCLLWFRRNRKDIIRGQLSADFLKSKNEMPWLVRFVMRNLLINIVTRPDFVAYSFVDRKTISNRLYRGLWGGTGVAWTLCVRKDFDTAVEEGWIPIFEKLKP